MDYLQNKINELERLHNEVPSQAEIIAKKYSKEILDFIRVKQLYEKGISGSGRKLKRYSKFTIEEKKLKGQPTDRTTLLDTGSFFAHFEIKFLNDDNLVIFSTDNKTNKLTYTYGDDIFDLTKGNTKTVNDTIFLKNLIKWLLNTKTFTQI